VDNVRLAAAASYSTSDGIKSDSTVSSSNANRRKQQHQLGDAAGDGNTAAPAML